MEYRTLLVYPAIPDTYWSLTGFLPFLGKKAMVPPLGLISVAALLPENFTCRVVDLNIEELSDDDLQWADLVFLSAMIVQKESFDEIIERARHFDCRIVAGGPYPTSSYHKIEGVDHFVLNEAEITLPLFIRDLEKGDAGPIYTSEEKPSMDMVPIPRFDLIDVQAYLTMAIQFSRGCPFNCEFCDIIEMFGRKPRVKSPEQLLGEVEAIQRTGFKGSIFLVDDNFIGHKRKVKDLLRAIIQWQDEHGYPFQFYTEASVDLASDEEMMQLMQDAGFDFVFLGLETPNEESLKATGKDQNLKMDLVEAVDRIQRHGMAVAGGFILGFDTDDETIFDRMIEFVEESSIPMAMVGLLAAMPNTQLYRRLEKEGRLLEDWSGSNTHNLEANFITTLPHEVLTEGYKRVLRTLYRPRNYFDRSLRFLKKLPRKKVSPPPYSVPHMGFILTISLIWQTFSFYGLEYLRYLFLGMRHRLSMLPDLISYSLQGHHFITYTRNMLEMEEFTMLLSAEKAIIRHRMKTLNDLDHNYYLGRELERTISESMTRMAKKYRELTRPTRKRVREAYREFVSSCQVTLDRLSQQDRETRTEKGEVISSPPLAKEQNLFSADRN
jgi:radical SAM superfamily enzyme YgiQ (UPF0313 family)